MKSNWDLQVHCDEALLGPLLRLGFKLCSLMAVAWLGVGVAQIDIPTKIVSFLMCHVCGAISISHSKSTFQNRFFFLIFKKKENIITH